MGNGYSPRILTIGTVELGAGLTNAEVGSEFGATAGGASRIRIEAAASSVTVGGGITLKLQQKILDSWVDLASANASVSITADGNYVIRMFIERAADQVDMPLAKQLRMVATTGAGSAVTFSKVTVLQSL